jgi:1-acyl-sn-glycerol-3-phosphate acyltransferase
MSRALRRQIPKEKLFVVKRNTKRIDFAKKFKFIYFDWWFQLFDYPFVALCTILSFFCALYFGLRVTGWKNTRILRKRGCITVSNHCHYFDTVFAGMILFPRRLYISIAQRNFEVPVIRRILRLVRGFPIPARKNGFDMISSPVGEALSRGHHVHFLPEGDLVYLSQEIFRFKSGAFRMACLHQAPILPMVYVFSRRRLLGKVQSRHWPRMRLVFGEPLFVPPLNPDGSFPMSQIRDQMEKVARWMEETIASFGDEKPADAGLNNGGVLDKVS